MSLEKLNQRTNKFIIVLNDSSAIEFKNAKSIITKFCDSEELDVCYISAICHDRDLDEVTQHVKTKHYHVVLELNKICRLGTLLNWISLNFHCNENQVSIDKCNSIPMQSRYLLHLDDFDKARYYEQDVATNNIFLFKDFLSLVPIRDVNDLIARVKEYHYDLEICMSKIVNFDKWRRYILDLINNYYRKCRM